jgi:hypothetical protein
MYSSKCALILLYMCPHTTICALILLYMYPHTTTCVHLPLQMRPHTPTHVSSYYTQHMRPHPTHLDEQCTVTLKLRPAARRLLKALLQRPVLLLEDPPLLLAADKQRLQLT